MKKISTLFAINFTDNLKGDVTETIRPENDWINDRGVLATRKFDGTACAIIKGVLYKRWDNKKGKKIPLGSIECQGKDEVTGHHPFWVLCDGLLSSDKYFYEALQRLDNKEDGTYELCGENVQNNPENIDGHRLIKHGSEVIELDSFSFNCIKAYLEKMDSDVEGIVFHHPKGMMCKIRKSDFLVKRNQIDGVVE